VLVEIAQKFCFGIITGRSRGEADFVTTRKIYFIHSLILNFPSWLVVMAWTYMVFSRFNAR
jgi:hypothetical protein